MTTTTLLAMHQDMNIFPVHQSHERDTLWARLHGGVDVDVDQHASPAYNLANT